MTLTHQTLGAKNNKEYRTFCVNIFKMNKKHLTDADKKYIAKNFFHLVNKKSFTISFDNSVTGQKHLYKIYNNAGKKLR